MKNLEIFHNILHGEHSPLMQNADGYQDQINYLKDQYSEFIQHYRICVEETSENKYQVRGQQQFTFAELPVVLSSRKSRTIGVNDLSEALRALLSDVLGNAYHCITDLRYYRNEGGYLFIEATTSEDYGVLSVQEVRFYYFQVMLDKVSKTIKKHLYEKVFMLADEKKARRHIKRYQTVMNAYLGNILNEYLSVQQQTAIYDISEAKNLTDIYKLIFQKLEEIQVHLEKTFYAYLDLSAPISYSSKLWLAATYQQKAEAILNQLKTLALSKEIISLVSLPLENLTKLQTMKFTYYDQQYHIEYADALGQLLEDSLPSGYTIIHFLKSLNFNALKFFLYVTSKISEELKQKDTVGQKLQTLYYYKKCLKESLVKTAYCYNRDLPSFREQMSRWFTENIGFYKRKFKQEKAQRSLAGTDTPTSKIPKQTVRLSVADMALMTRLFYENDLLEGTRKSALEFISYHYRTPRTASIAWDSLDRKYYDVPQSTKRKIRKLLKAMLAQLDEQIQ